MVVFRDPAGLQRKRFTRTLAEARNIKATLRGDVARGEYRRLSRVTLANYASEWIETYTGRTKRGLGDGTRDDYRGALDRDILPTLGRVRLAELEPPDVKRLGANLAARGLAPASVSKTIAPLKALLATALEDGLIQSNPAAGVRLAQPTADDAEQDAPVKALTEDELARVFDELPPEWRFFFEFLFETGLRIGEAIELRWRDVEGDWLRVDRRYYRGRIGLPKGRKKRRIPLSESMARAFWTRRRDVPSGPDDFIFSSARGLRIDPSNLMSRVLKPAAVRAGVGAWVGFHTFRHTCATALFRRGWNAVQAQKFLGHADAGFTLRTYVHLLEENLPIPAFSIARPLADVRPDQGERVVSTR